MSIHTLTLDEFMQLDASHHREAISQYNEAIDTVATNLKGYQSGSPEREQQLDKLTRLATLRKVHKGALSELEPTSKMGGGSLATTSAAA